jgi:hypothetical protein
MATIHGDNTILDDVRLALYTLMNNLMAAMAAAGDSPRPLAVYNTHEVTNMTLPCYSVGIMGVSLRGKESGRSASDTRETYDITADIRANTDFRGGYLNEITLSRLLNSASNWIQTHRSLSLGGFCFVDTVDILFDETFPESLTIGGRIRLQITLQMLHRQI